MQAAAAGTGVQDEASFDPMLRLPSATVRENDHILLHFSDGRKMFSQAVKHAKGKLAPLKVNKVKFHTYNLIGLSYGAVLELSQGRLVPLPPGEDLLPSFGPDDSDERVDDNNGERFSITQTRDNRDMYDTNTSQALHPNELREMVSSGVDGATIVQQIVQNSSTFEHKTEFSKAKYIARKQMKYQLRCRIVRCTAAAICDALYSKDPKRIMCLRPDSLGQILSYANVCAGRQVLVCETIMGIVTGAVAEKLGGHGKVLAIYSGQYPHGNDWLERYNLSFPAQFSIKWLHSGDVFGDQSSPDDADDPEKADRDACVWPCKLQSHTRQFLENMRTDKERHAFLAKRQARFARKLTRNSPGEVKQMLLERKCDSLIIAARYDPSATLLPLLAHLESACPFVVFCEFLEPLTACFKILQKRELAANLRLSDTWAREYQVLPGRTHPQMTMAQSGGFILTGIKLDETYGRNDLGEDTLQRIRNEVGGRRKRNGGAKRKQTSPVPDNAAAAEKKIKADDSAANTDTDGGESCNASSTHRI